MRQRITRGYGEGEKVVVLVGESSVAAGDRRSRRNTGPDDVVVPVGQRADIGRGSG